MNEDSSEKKAEKLVNDLFKSVFDDTDNEEKMDDVVAVIARWEHLTDEEKAEAIVLSGTSLLESVYEDMYDFIVHIAERYLFKFQLTVAASTLIIYLAIKGVI